MIWNIDSYNAPPSHSQPTSWETALQRHTFSFVDDQPRFRHEQWRKVFEDQVSRSLLNVIVAADDPLFSMPLGVNEEGWTAWLSREKVWERYRTLGQVAILEGEELAVSWSLFFSPSLPFPLPVFWFLATAVCTLYLSNGVLVTDKLRFV